jgi:hypothetical protein
MLTLLSRSCQSGSLTCATLHRFESIAKACRAVLFLVFRVRCFSALHRKVALEITAMQRLQ